MHMVEREMLRDARNYLDITYEDEETDRKLAGILERGKSYLNNVAGTELDYEEGTCQRALLFDYCRYAGNNALELFEENFKTELISLRIGEQVKDYAEQQGYV